ncbi:hypothetical protein [Nonomuraea harbinensis]|uniref:Uncharacterized protein n=1 Tax=Nonomuraea harbinensis TaxID=1286938 RepID=A0ABW1CAD9_9ACTN|nr:hypothetical protein [Nonomuraea harbinensis]
MAAAPAEIRTLSVPVQMLLDARVDGRKTGISASFDLCGRFSGIHTS